MSLSCNGTVTGLAEVSEVERKGVPLELAGVEGVSVAGANVCEVTAVVVVVAFLEVLSLLVLVEDVVEVGVVVAHSAFSSTAVNLMR